MLKPKYLHSFVWLLLLCISGAVGENIFSAANPSCLRLLSHPVFKAGVVDCWTLEIETGLVLNVKLVFAPSMNRGKNNWSILQEDRFKVGRWGMGKSFLLCNLFHVKAMDLLRLCTSELFSVRCLSLSASLSDKGKWNSLCLNRKPLQTNFKLHSKKPLLTMEYKFCRHLLEQSPVLFIGCLPTPWWRPTRRACWATETMMWMWSWQRFRPKAMRLFGGTNAGTEKSCNSGDGHCL